jgi:small subunit ribosomal protein S20
MANTVTSLKRVRITEKRTEINRARKSRMRTAIKVMRKLLEAKKTTEATAELPKVFSVVDRAAKQGIIKKNTAARYKSRLHKRVKALAA